MANLIASLGILQMFQRANLLAAAAAILTLAGAASADAAACRDAKGHFAACPAPAAKVTTVERCRSAHGTFTSCSASAAVARAPRVAPAATAAAVNSVAVAPGAVSARCKDGTLSHSLHRSGSCSGHGGVAAWM